MRPNINSRLALFLAGILPFMPVLRIAVPVIRTIGNPSAAWIFKWVIGAAIVGYDAVSSASSVSISPPSATIGVPYSGTLTYSGGHAGAVESMNLNGTCLGTYTVAPGLTARYNSVNTATVTGTPTGSAGTVNLSVTVYEYGCGSGLSDSRSTSLIIQSSGGGSIAPSMLVVPSSVVAPVGSDVILSGGASGNPAPAYYWRQGITVISGATNNTLLIPSVQLTNSGTYSLYASNGSGQANALCYLSVAIPPGSNSLALQYTNYAPAGTPLTIYSYYTNVPSASNGYDWYNGSSDAHTTNSYYTLTVAQTAPNRSGTITVHFNSLVGSIQAVNDQQYLSYWTYGFTPTVSVQPSGASVNPGTNVTFSFTMGGGNYPYVFLYQNQTNLVWQTNLPSYNPSTAGATTNLGTTISNVTTASSGFYTFVATNYWGSITSTPANLTVSLPFSVPTPPSQTNYAGSHVNLNAAPVGTGPFYFQWQKGGNYLSDGGNILGSGTSNLLVAPVAISNSGNYQVVVTNTSGSLTSGVAILTVLPVPSMSVMTGGSGITLNAAGGVVGSNYVVEVSSNLAAGTWAPLKTNVVPPSGLISFTDTNFATPGLFYRLFFP